MLPDFPPPLRIGQSLVPKPESSHAPAKIVGYRFDAAGKRLVWELESAGVVELWSLGAVAQGYRL